MTFTADQYSQIATGYHKAAADPFIPPEKREEFARKAAWFRFLAERDNGTLHPGGTVSKGSEGSGTDPTFEPSSPAPKRSLKPLLTMLWVTGAATYLIGTVLFTSLNNPFRSEDKQNPEVTRPIASPGAFARREEIAGVQPTVPPTPDKRHAISPDQPSYEAPGLIVPPSATDEEHKPSPASPARTEQASAPAASSSEPEVLKVHGAATIRNGPSATAKVIGTASPGAELQVKARENGWVQFVDPSSGNTGWIESDLVAPASARGETSVAVTRSEEAPSLTAQKPKPFKQRVKKKPREPSEVAKQRPSRPSPPARDRAYADLPEDDDFLADTLPHRKGFFARRRMLREGLMSPDFIPPQ
jgi:Bacterial SH3 domain